MSTAGLVVVLVVALGEAEEPSTKAALTSTRDALDETAVVLVREIPMPPAADRTSPSTPLDATSITRLGEELHAGAVVVLQWREAERRTVMIHSSIARHEWIDRTLTFMDVDPPLERGKTIGFEIASMIPRTWLRASETTPRENDTTHAKPEDPNQTQPRRSHPFFGVEGDLHGAVGDNASGVGGEIAFRATPFDGLIPGARVAAGMRFGSLPDADARAVVVRFAAGPLVSFIRRRQQRSASQPFGLGLRLDGLVLLQHLTRRDGGESSGSRLVPGVGSMLEGSWMVSDRIPVALVAGVGVEVAFGGTKVLVDERTTATIEPVRGVAELGFLWEF